MLSKAWEKKIKLLHTKKGREKSGFCLVEGEKDLDAAGDAVVFRFTRDDSPLFDELVDTETPQDVAGVARIPRWSMGKVSAYSTIVVLDGVQDPGNVGSIFRLCLGFGASLILIDSVDVTNSKVVRSSVGALFHVPWVKVSRTDAASAITQLRRPLYRLERNKKSLKASVDVIAGLEDDIVLLAGSEGRGIRLAVPGVSLEISHNPDLESLNVSHSLAIVLHLRYNTSE